MRLQSAIEFLSTYGFMLLLVAIIFAALIYFAYPTKTLLQSQCTAFGPVKCNFAIFHSDTASNSANVIFSISNGGAAPISVTGANVVLGSKTFSGTCSPSIMIPGATSICHATVTPAQSIGTQVSGYFSINAKLCNSPASQFGNAISQPNCTYDDVVYSGEFLSYASLITANSISTTSTSSISTTSKTTTSKTTTSTITIVPTTTTIYYVPIMLTNTQSSPTPSLFQQAIDVASSTYSKYLNNAWTNVVFTTGNYYQGNGYSLLPAWLESGNSNTTSDSQVWVRLASSIPASGSTTIYMNFVPMSTTMMSAQGPTGEAPQLSSPYAANDNGGSVFTFYDNFIGTSLNSSKWSSGSAATVNDGIVLTPPASGYYFLTSSPTFYSGNTLDFLGTPTNNNGKGGVEFGFGDCINCNPVGSSGFVGDKSGTSLPFLLYLNSSTTTASAYPIMNGVWTMGIDSAGTQAYSQLSYIDQYTVSNAFPFNNAQIKFRQPSGANAMVVQWLRVRSTPPNFVMPSTTFGVVSSSQSSQYHYTVITLSPSSTISGDFQQRLSIPWSISYPSTGWQYVEFSTGNYMGGNGATPVYAWIESGGTTSGTSVVFVNLPNGETNGEQLYMNFMSSPVMTSTSSYTGESPKLSGTYGEYDNGAKVFLTYANFQGSSIPSGWSVSAQTGSFTPAISGGGLEMMNNVGAQSTALHYSSAFTTLDTITEASWMYNGGADDLGIGLYTAGPDTSNGGRQPASSSGYYNTYEFYKSSAPAIVSPSGTALAVASSQVMATSGQNYVFSRVVATPTSMEMDFATNTGSMYQSGLYTVVGLAPPYSTIVSYSGTISNANSNFYAGASAGGSTSYIYLYWIRTRAYPPGGTMPSYAIGTYV